jgi:hypothetical protein
MIKTKFILLTVIAVFSSMIVQAQSSLGSTTVKVNETKTITLNSTYRNVLQNNASSINYRWYSNNTSVASVSSTSFRECRVTGKKEGTCKVYFEASFFIGNKFDRYNFYWDVIVSGYTSGASEVDPTRVTMDISNLTLEVGQAYDLSYEVYPANATYTSTWRSRNESVVTVSNTGHVTAIAPGKTTVEVWAYGPHNVFGDACVVTVKEQTIVNQLFDENTMEIPQAAYHINAIINRSLAANKWSTICLPFTMSEAQTKAAFGDDVEIADFTGYEAEKDADNSVVKLVVNFNDVTKMEANHPYIIKVKNDISQFTVDGVDVTPADNPMTVYDNGETGDQQEIYGSFIGTYVADTYIPNNCLFINNNKFWYSAGMSKLKAFRAYFDFKDVLADVDEQNESRIIFSFENETTGIKEINENTLTKDKYFDLQGRQIKRPTKGIYVVNGKKIKF